MVRLKISGRLLLLGAAMCFSLFTAANNKIWTGLAGDGRWSTAANWSDHTLPAPADDVLLDESVWLSDYQVLLPDVPVEIHSLRIAPAAGHNIRLLLPDTNLGAPGFSVTGSILLDAGAIFENASGIASGETLLIADSLRIANGGKYIHRTRGAHAGSIVSHLSVMPGTETGIFEFDVPRSSYTISASNRTYGTLSLRADALGAPVNYTCSGSNPLTVRGDLRINDGVQFSVDLSGPLGNISIAGDFIESAGVFNIASGTGNSTVVKISGNVIQAPGAGITATALAEPVLSLTGNNLQALSFAGTISGPVGFRLDNPSGALLVSSLMLPHSLELLSGRLISSAANLLSLAADCRVICDTMQTAPAYVDGPLKKYGLAGNPYFLFPVGKNGLLRWIEIKNGTGDFTVEYQHSNPRDISASCAAGLDHVSALEYWQVQAGSSATGTIELSYRMPTSGGVTDPSFLSIARLDNDVWKNTGNTGITGDYRGGSVCSDLITDFASNDFTLGSTIDAENPLPVSAINWSGQRVNGDIFFQWTTDLPAPASYFELWGGSVTDMIKLDSIPASGTGMYNCWTHNQRGTDRFYQLRAADKMGKWYLSNILHFASGVLSPDRCRAIGNPVTGEIICVEIPVDQTGLCHWAVFSMDGKRIRDGMDNSTGLLKLRIGPLARGMYLIKIRLNHQQGCVLPIVKR